VPETAVLEQERFFARCGRGCGWLCDEEFEAAEGGGDVGSCYPCGEGDEEFVRGGGVGPDEFVAVVHCAFR
jgi:hypothetical protein